jgi:hypothetical protein
MGRICSAAMTILCFLLVVVGEFIVVTKQMSVFGT